ncbi:hypothetical protein BJ878DRAFT_516737 [Calycina marina]|uniref:Uncharacterized protein n=1 Tax=Calycina marina TaxID=1763456 RepID=A0A9P7YZD2_9HELO|nr:hypothetical protein BJ878DRAFT_516737 [Calycina marina]
MQTQQQLVQNQPNINGHLAQAISELKTLVANPPATNVAVQQDTIPVAPYAQSTGGVKSHHSPPHPKLFTGEDLSLYPQFKSLLKAKLRLDAKAIDNEEERIWHGYRCLRSKSQSRIHPWIYHAESRTN